MQQVDTPTNLYNKPCNLFVAGFIGSPQMNFVDATIVERGADLVATFGRSAITLPADKAKALRDGGYVGKVVVMGVRPEDVIEQGAPAEGKCLSEAVSATVTVYELLGSSVMLYADAEGASLSCSTEATTTARTGSEVQLVFDVDKLHFFDKQTELAICH